MPSRKPLNSGSRPLTQIEIDSLVAKIPEIVRDDVRVYLKKVDTSVPADRALICACLLVASESRLASFFPKGDTVLMQPIGSVAMAWFGEPWESDPDDILPRYRKARQSMEQVYQSAKAARTQVGKVLALIEELKDTLPLVIEPCVPNVRRCAEYLDSLLDITYPEPEDPAMNIRRRKLPEERLDRAQQAFLWWRVAVQGNRRWKHCHALARAWRLTEAEDVTSFRRHVLRLKKGVTEEVPPPEWCQQLCHSRG